LFTSIWNFRDLGGTVTRDGNMVRSGRFYRSDSLAWISAHEADLAAFGALGIRTVIDLQRPEEIAVHGHIPDTPDRRYLNIAPDHALWDRATYDEIAGPPRYLADRYLDMARTGRADFAKVLSLLADPETAPVVVHCFAGKDRTGITVALTLGLLGVTDDVIADDYAISNTWPDTHAPPPEMPAYFVVAPRAAMMLFLHDLRAEYGSVEEYANAAGFGPDCVADLRVTLLDRRIARG
jgi:protein tyrosine/serine phosphatase